MNIFNLSEGHYLSLCKQRIPLNALYLLEMIKNGKECNEDLYLSNLQWLQRKGYIDNKQMITQYGEELYDSLFKEKEHIAVKKVARVIKEDVFEKWWQIFPSSDNFEIDGKEFKGTSQKRLQKEECRKLFTILSISQFTAEQIIDATAYHIQTAKELSVKKKSNQVTYIVNTERYLREKRFEAFIGKGKPKEKTKEFEI